MIEIVGNLCELEGVAKVEIWLRMEKLEREKKKVLEAILFSLFEVRNIILTFLANICVRCHFDWGIFLALQIKKVKVNINMWAEKEWMNGVKC